MKHVSMMRPMATGKPVWGIFSLQRETVQKEQRKGWKQKGKRQRKSCIQKAQEPLQRARIAYTAFCSNCL